VALFLGHGALLAVAGIGVGLARAVGVTRFLRAMLFGVSPFDPTSFVAITLVSSAIVFLASYLPARRAARVDPIEGAAAGVSSRRLPAVTTVCLGTIEVPA